MAKRRLDYSDGELHTHDEDIHLRGKLLAEHTCIATTNDEVLSNATEIADEIAKRWNCHDDLLEACKQAMEYLSSSSKLDWDNILTPVLEAAIAKAERGE